MKKSKASHKCTLFFFLLNTRNSQQSFQNRESGWDLYSLNSWLGSNSPLTIFWLIHSFSIQVLKSVVGPWPAQIGSPGSWQEMQILRPHPKPAESGTLGRTPGSWVNKPAVILRDTQVWEPLLYSIPPKCWLSGSKLKPLPLGESSRQRQALWFRTTF